jgi:hypothetical protein
MRNTGFYTFIEEEAKKLPEYNKVLDEQDLWRNAFANNNDSSYAYRKPYYDLCNREREIEKEIEEEFLSNVFYTWDIEEKIYAMSMAFYKNKFYIIYTYPGGYDPETCILIFDTKEEFLSYLKLDELKQKIMGL